MELSTLVYKTSVIHSSMDVCGSLNVSETARIPGVFYIVMNLNVTFPLTLGNVPDLLM